MGIKRKNIPDGMRDMIYSENKPSKQLGERLMSLYEKRGFGNVVTPTLEYYDVFNFDTQTIPEENMFKLTDKSGRLVVLRPDNTTPMARIAATRLKNAPLPIKLCYNQNVFRISRDYSGKRSEFAQTGIEIIGGDTKRADIEVIVTALRTLREISEFFGGDVKYKLEIGHVGFCKAILDSMGLGDDQLEIVRAYVGAKNSSSLDVLLGENQSLESAIKVIQQIPRLYGGRSVLDKARHISGDVEDAKNALDYLEKIFDVLDENGFSENISIDLAIVNDMEYYTGIVFRGYLEYAGEPILGGGRYDGLLPNFDFDAPATGFGVNLSLIADKLTRAVGKGEREGKTILVHYAEASLLSKALNYMENNGDVCELSCFDELEKAVEYAKNSGIEKVVEITKSGIKEAYSL